MTHFDPFCGHNGMGVWKAGLESNGRRDEFRVRELPPLAPRCRHQYCGALRRSELAISSRRPLRERVDKKRRTAHIDQGEWLEKFTVVRPAWTELAQYGSVIRTDEFPNEQKK